MRSPLAIGSLVLLTGCSTLPDPDPNQAWVDLAPHDETSLHAVQVDERDWADNRYFEVQPGNHELTVRYQFPVAPSNIGPVNEPLWRDCQLNLNFKDFSAGQRYSLQAGSIGFRPWIKLYDQQQKLVGQGAPAGCQRT
ncbi:hypothetical protein [Pseudomonas sp. BP8]|uniref:PA0061/PA0062 family lipoprotein n=1 Tax=Pseudomonas sp. BP8 TaxID=2817864 RepID=UPI001AE223DC|nr:hypothetical protein [Pseudomonas sp. BP8]MBP2259590.1 hypothetical protein [Pseudomonas sp. BP8]HDS1733607.1 hypothetical protein [Pseudomonas putida]